MGRRILELNKWSSESRDIKATGVHNVEMRCMQRKNSEELWRASFKYLAEFPGVSDSKESSCNAGDLVWEDSLEEGMATHFGIVAREIASTEEPGGLQRVGQD